MRSLTYVRSLHANLRTDERAAPRYSLNLQCYIASSQFGRRRALLRDVSLDGCRIVTPFNFARAAALVVTIEMLGPRGGMICWNSPGEVGLRFSFPLHQAVIDQLIKRDRAVAIR